MNFRSILRHALFLLSLGLFLPLVASGCGEEPDDDDTTADDDDDTIFDDDDDDSGGGPEPCEPALTAVALPTAANPLSLVTVLAEGGTGAYRFALSEEPSPSGAALNEITGAYIAGAVTGVTDTVVVSDLGCLGSASVDIPVYEGMDVAPEEGQVPTDTSFVFEVSGGSGAYSCEELQNQTGAVLGTEDCSYTSGTVEGLDGIRVRDEHTDEIVDVWLEVAAAAELHPSPPLIALALGSSYLLDMVGGTGHFDAVVDGTSATLTDGVFESVEEGLTSFDLTDRFTGLTAAVSVDVVASSTIPLTRAGDLTIHGVLEGAGDVNCDGYTDALMGWPEGDIQASNGGVVSLWLGTDTGLHHEPEMTWTSDGWEDGMGRGLTVGDFDGDEQPDLAIGTPLRDASAADTGRVDVHYGLPCDGFPQSADLELAGLNNGDRLGESLVACDFNGDGIDDLAAGAVRAEDRNQPSVYGSQGAVYIYEGTAAGLPSEPDYAIYGMVPTPAGWTMSNNVYLGWRTEVGYVDDDEYCDLLVSSFEYNGSDGAVFLYLGGSEGLGAEPVEAWAATLNGSGTETFGRQVAVGDVNDDGNDDILIGARALDTAGGTNTGGAFLFLGKDYEGEPTPTDFTYYTEADWAVAGTAWDLLGADVDIADYDGDGVLDIIAAEPFQEMAGSPSNSGAVHIYQGLAPAVPSTTASWVLTGENTTDVLGLRVLGLGDVEGDALPDLLVLAGRHDAFGYSVGTPIYISGDSSQDWRYLEHEGVPAGQGLGWSGDFVGDFDNDGYGDLAVSANKQDHTNTNVNGGAVYLHRGGPDGFAAESDLALELFVAHGNTDEFGYGVSGAGDFTGDGVADIAVISRIDYKPSSFNSNYANPTDCPGGTYGTGSARIFAGLSGGLPTLPTIQQATAIWYGPGGNLHSVDGGFDFNGDGLSDIVVGAANDDVGLENNGSVHVVYGRAPDPSGLIYVVCEPDPADPDPEVWTFAGLGDQDQLGRSVAALGDIDGDGCDEFASGADEADFGGQSNQGAVHVFFGEGAGCAAGPRMLTLVPQDTNARAGWSLDYGPDVDGDGLGDLAVGGYNLIVNSDAVGGGWVIPGSYLAGLTPEAADPGAPDTAHPFNDTVGSWRIEGWRDGERAGRSVALVPPYGSEGLGGLLMGSPRGAVSGTGQAGGARLHHFEPSGDPVGLSDVPAFTMGGETDNLNGEIGEWVRSGTVNGKVYVLVGGYQGHGVGVDTGSAYVVELGDAAP